MKREFRIKVPASTTNLGPGFDCLGLAICLYNEIIISESDEFSIILDEKDIGIIPTDKSNLIIQAMEKTYEVIGETMPNITMKQINNIPLARGLGSSAACLVAGIIGANALAGDKLSFDEMLNLAAKMDGHPDNVLPSFVGGLTAATMEGESTKYVKMQLNECFRFIFIIPNYELKTKLARSVLPDSYSRADAVASIGRGILMTTSLVYGHRENLKIASKDTIHQPYRTKLMPDYDSISDIAYEAGADGVFISGAGSGIGVIISENAEDIIRTIKSKLDENYTIIDTNVDMQGATII